MNRSLPVVVIGAGPVGLAAAAHLLRPAANPDVQGAAFVAATGSGSTSGACSVPTPRSVSQAQSSCCGGEKESAAPAATAAKVEASGCCGGPPTEGAEACCKLDEEKKSAGEAGCGCSSGPKAKRPPAAVCC